ncbi:potential E3 ubiquitin-protein ligase ariadne-2 [Galendromus occidentalis]|uniref:RBR-type E3 ubiquitin transferase n=1 Tax=Galendromus occidentalis TaxID=34638 RepID=A0AAJ6VXC9_9ACAR|nr:potential E3 ubiquitin-protein ligase ariadne-2 [Galendromus occidentalis]
MSDAHTSSDEDDLYDEGDYYSQSADIESEATEADIEAYHFECVTPEDVDKLFATAVNDLTDKLILQEAGVARMLLHHFQWNCQEVVERYKKNPAQTLALARIRSITVSPDNNNAHFCQTCFQNLRSGEFRSLDCGHQFCADCWTAFLEVQIGQGRSTEIACMSQGCDILAPMEFVLQLIAPKSALLEARYLQFCRNDWIRTHPQLRFCPGRNCQAVIRVEQILAKRVKCSFCQTQFCCRCGGDYHAPADCETIKKWITKCADDSETANYISAHTKDCPMCHVCIEKNGGCNHMQCSGCKYDFCWMCLGDWKTHGSQYYECSRYKENPNIANESVNAQAREALKKYLFYFERWENHAKSLRLEEVMREKIQNRINQKVMAKEGTWIDWQYLLDAAALLAKCRYTLQYTYPYAYFLDPGPRKELFEYQQATLEAEIENLSWKLERAETTQRGELGNQMVIAEKRRSILLKDFLSP